MHSIYFRGSLNNNCLDLLPPCTCHIREIATCRLRLWAPLVASNINNDDDNNNNNNSINNNNNSLPRILMTTNKQSEGICSVTITSNNNNNNDDEDDDDDNNNSLLTEHFVVGIIHPQVKRKFSLFLFLMNN